MQFFKKNRSPAAQLGSSVSGVSVRPDESSLPRASASDSLNDNNLFPTASRDSFSLPRRSQHSLRHSYVDGYTRHPAHRPHQSQDQSAPLQQFQQQQQLQQPPPPPPPPPPQFHSPPSHHPPPSPLPLGRSKSQHTNPLRLSPVSTSVTGQRPSISVVTPAVIATGAVQGLGSDQQNPLCPSEQSSWSSPSPDSPPSADTETRKFRKRFALHHTSSAPTDSPSISRRSFTVRRKAQPGLNLYGAGSSLPPSRRPSAPSIDFRPVAGGEYHPSDALMQQNGSRPFQDQPLYASQPPMAGNQGRPSFDPPPMLVRTGTDFLGTAAVQRGDNDLFRTQVSSTRVSSYQDQQQPSPLHSPPHAFQYSSHDPSVPRQSLTAQESALSQRRSAQLDPNYRPSSQQSHGPPSPVPPQSHLSDVTPQPQIHLRRQSQHLSTTAQSQSQEPQPSQQQQRQQRQSGFLAADRSTGLRQAGESSQLSRPQNSSSQDSAHSPYPPDSEPPPALKDMVSQLEKLESDRQTPPIAPSNKEWKEPGEIDVRALVEERDELIQKQDELQSKYNKVKRLYFEKDGQVQQLQNMVAHQRMAISRTVLDDNEYVNRFNRLDAAIKDLAFSIRKCWENIPPWLHVCVKEDALTTRTKEMTAVGRAFISRWLVDEIFDRHFHPCLEVHFSTQLKGIEKNLRRQQAQAYSDEDRENQVARISNWRRTTLDGLSDVLQSMVAQDCRTKVVDSLVDKMVAGLGMHLKDPPPSDIGHSARTIVENALAIAEKIPLEARDISVEYFMPGTPVMEPLMKIEPLPQLANSGPEPLSSLDHDRGSSQGVDGQNEDADMESSTGSTPTDSILGAPKQPGVPPTREPRKKHGLGSFISKKSAANSEARPRSTGRESKDRCETDKQENRTIPRIRFAAFVVVEVKGRGPNNVLIKAPVYSMDQ